MGGGDKRRIVSVDTGKEAAVDPAINVPGQSFQGREKNRQKNQLQLWKTGEKYARMNPHSSDILFNILDRIIPGVKVFPNRMFKATQ